MNQVYHFFKLTFSVVFIWIISIHSNAQKQTPQRPNIVWIVMEDMSPQFYGAYGNTAANTPVIDSLINAGIRFDAAFSTGAVCSPSRYSIITGTRTNEYGTGHHRSNYPIPTSVKPFPHFLKNAGYHTSNNSKRDYNTSERWRITREAWVESSATAGWWNRTEDQPFFSVFNFNNSHQSRTFTNPYKNYKGRILDQLSPDERIADEAIILPDYYKDTPEMRRELARTYNALKKIDNEIDTLMNKLRKEKLVESTIIFIYSDHGGGGLRTKSKGIALGHQVPMVVITPPAYAHLNPFKNQKATSQPVTFEDLAPTILALAGLDAPDYMTGKAFLGEAPEAQQYAFTSADRCGEAYNLTRSVSDGRYYYTRSFYPNRPAYSYQKYFDYAASRQLIRSYHMQGQLNPIQAMPLQTKPTEMLYDLKEDTWQTNNLAANPKFRKVKKKLSKALDNKLRSAKDVLFLPECTLDSISKTTTPFEYKSSDAYEFEAIYDMASLVGTGDKSIKKQLQGLGNENPIVRYWAALGLSAQAKSDLSPFQSQLKNQLTDDFPPVRIQLAALLLSHFGDPDARAVLTSYIHHDNTYLSLQAVQEILYLPKSESVLFMEEIKKLQGKEGLSGLLSESIDMYRYLHEGRELVYKTHW
ncbi:sulfatase-like hydrolase/transferase [Marinoscillum furvescens]|uniref:Arylsulfatase A-like enzyme n=1 Tax=Marinoscillum furvescens DSM 4134 TaxID=1122208 RepID=A0A3D9L952_MARFU|nr:sulfatase-like hydrolase/transferase [Marinoscillum furvescens]REE02204.1 arylsulfatase A-like enzyme [Marinoscillum furvescens DSM 4134]